MSASGVLWGGVKGVSGLESGLLIWVLCRSVEGFWAVKAGGVDLALRAHRGGVWSACGAWWGFCGWVLKSAAGGMVVLLTRLFWVTCFLSPYDYCC